MSALALAATSSSVRRAPCSACLVSCTSSSVTPRAGVYCHDAAAELPTVKVKPGATIGLSGPIIASANTATLQEGGG